MIGRIYKGDSIEDVLNKYLAGSDYSYSGQVSNDKIIEYEEGGRLTTWNYDGIYEHGMGISYELDGEVYNSPIYEGEFRKGKRHGAGLDYLDWNYVRFKDTTPIEGKPEDGRENFESKDDIFLKRIFYNP